MRGFRGRIWAIRTAMLAVVMLLVGAGAGGCAGQERVDLSGAWPEAPSDYADAHQRWTRKRSVYNGLDHVVSVAATALSPDFRAAYAAERARRLDMPDNERAELISAEKTQSAEVIEFEVLVATNRSDWNDLTKWPRSMWRIALVGDDGREVLPTKILADKRVRAEIAQWFPDLGPFYKPYVITFPRVAADGKPILSESSTRMTLELASAVGRAELTWSAR